MVQILPLIMNLVLQIQNKTTIKQYNKEFFVVSNNPYGVLNNIFQSTLNGVYFHIISNWRWAHFIYSLIHDLGFDSDLFSNAARIHTRVALHYWCGLYYWWLLAICLFWDRSRSMKPINYAHPGWWKESIMHI